MAYKNKQTNTDNVLRLVLHRGMCAHEEWRWRGDKVQHVNGQNGDVDVTVDEGIHEGEQGSTGVVYLTEGPRENENFVFGHQCKDNVHDGTDAQLIKEVVDNCRGNRYRLRKGRLQDLLVTCAQTEAYFTSTCVFHK